ncbi:perlucin-like [Mytilus edulis]|uniref:perlucin-like n=1 Tax=Mytilus edulis TaxID=6550 RepID=UPI0039EE83D6
MEILIKVYYVILGIILSCNSPPGCLAQESICRTGWVYFDSSCYFFYTAHHVTWKHATMLCQTRNTYLVAIETAAENNFIHAQVKRLGGGYWLGGSDEFVEGQWEWASIGQPFQYTNWYPGAPDNQLHHQDCLMTKGDFHNGWWDDVDCNQVGKFICEENLRGPVIG